MNLSGKKIKYFSRTNEEKTGLFCEFFKRANGTPLCVIITKKGNIITRNASDCKFVVLKQDNEDYNERIELEEY